MRFLDLSPHMKMRIRGWSLEECEGHLYSLKVCRWTGTDLCLQAADPGLFRISKDAKHKVQMMRALE